MGFGETAVGLPNPYPAHTLVIGGQSDEAQAFAELGQYEGLRTAVAVGLSVGLGVVVGVGDGGTAVVVGVSSAVGEGGISGNGRRREEVGEGVAVGGRGVEEGVTGGGDRWRWGR